MSESKDLKKSEEVQSQHLPDNDKKSDIQMLIDIVAEAARSADVDTDKMEKIINLQERILDRNAKMAYSAAMSRVQREIRPVVRNADNNQTHSKYARLDAIINEVTPVYTEAGFSISFGIADSPMAKDGKPWIRVVAHVMHIEGHAEHVHIDMPMDLTGPQGSVNKTGPHAYKSSVTYARNTLLCMIFNIALKDEDDDGNAAGGNAAGGQISDQTDDGFINQNQINEIRRLVNQTGKSMGAFCRKAGIQNIADLPVQRFERSRQYLIDQANNTQPKRLPA